VRGHAVSQKRTVR